MGRTAILLGITGLTGGILAKKLFADERYSSVISIHRRASDLKDPKLTEIIGTIDSASPQTADVLFCCVGTTKQKTPDEEKYKEIDYGIPIKAANFCKENDINTLVVVSAMGADPNSRIFYNRLKGEMERDVLKYEVARTFLMQPSLINGDRNEKRTGEALAKKLMNVLNPILIGPLAKYKSIDAEKIAAAMLVVDMQGYSTSRIQSDEIRELAKKYGI